MPLSTYSFLATTGDDAPEFLFWLLTIFITGPDSLRVSAVHYSSAGCEVCRLLRLSSRGLCSHDERQEPASKRGRAALTSCLLPALASPDSVKSVKLSSAPMLGAQASREQARLTELRAQVSAGWNLFSDLLFASQTRHSSKRCCAAECRRTLQCPFQQTVSPERFWSIPGSGFRYAMD